MSESARILVIDDELHPRRITVRLLERAGYLVTEAETGQEGLRLAREQRPDLILLDVVLPDLDGFEVCRRMKTDPELAHILVVLLSGKRVDSDSVADGLEGGANGYLLRGTPPREFLARIDAWLRIKRMEHRLRESESWRELAISGSNGGIWHVRLDPDDPTHALPDEVYLSPRLKRFVGYAEDELPNSIAAWEALVHPDDLPKLRESSARHRRGETELHELEYRIRHKDGRIRWLHTCGRIERDAHARPARFAGMDWDITERKQAEEILRWNKVIVSSISDPISFVDRSYTYRAVNETYSRYAKRPASEIVGSTVTELLGQEVFEDAVRPHLDRCFAGHEVHYQAWFDVPDESPKFMDVGYYPVHDERGAVVGAVVNSRDITERRRAEEALSDSLQREQFLGDIVRNASIGIGVGHRDGSLGMSNLAAQELTGYSAEELETLNWRTDLTPPEWREHEAAHLRQLDRSKAVVRFEKEYVRKDGSRVPVELVVHPQLDESGNVSGYVSFVSDISERQVALEALRRERDLVARIMETSPVGIVVLDREGQIAFVNAQVERLTGLTREQIVRLDYDDPTWQMMDLTGQPLPDELLLFPRLMRAEEPIYDLEQIVELPALAGRGPRRLHLSMNAAPLYDAAGEIDGVVVTIQDITERVQLQHQVEQHAADLAQRVAERTAELKASQAALLRAERLAVAGKLAASLTHEISNPLQSVIGCLGLAEETLDEGGDARQYLEIALPELRRVARIVARLRNLGRPPSPLSSRESVQVGELLEQVQALVRKPCQDQGIVLDVRAPPGLPPVHVVPDQLQQVFLNLTLNAIEAMPSGSNSVGRIEVRATRTGEPSGVSISFHDSGVGISGESLPHIFDPFYSTKPEGLGLGLSISQEIVRHHGGRIEASGELGIGATFTVWLPAHPDGATGGSS